MDTLSGHSRECKMSNIFYYSLNAKYPQTSASTLANLKAFQFKAVEDSLKSGYITFRFNIDCNGKIEAGVQVLQTDDKYQSTHFDNHLVNELFIFLKTLDKWKIVKSKTGEAFSYRSFITFKLQNGKVVNIIP